MSKNNILLVFMCGTMLFANNVLCNQTTNTYWLRNYYAFVATTSITLAALMGLRHYFETHPQENNNNPPLSKTLKFASLWGAGTATILSVPLFFLDKQDRTTTLPGKEAIVNGVKLGWTLAEHFIVGNSCQSRYGCCCCCRRSY